MACWIVDSLDVFSLFAHLDRCSLAAMQGTADSRSKTAGHAHKASSGKCPQEQTIPCCFVTKALDQIHQYNKGRAWRSVHTLRRLNWCSSRSLALSQKAAYGIQLEECIAFLGYTAADCVAVLARCLPVAIASVARGPC